MLMLRGITKSLNLITRLAFNYNQPPRDPSLPTESQVMLPYSINFLHDNKGAVRYPKQIGRGPGSGKGKTAGRGHKGQLSRSGGSAHPRFEGGQTPITKRLPKYGRVFRARLPEQFTVVNLKQLNYYIKTGVIDATQTITIRTLVEAGLAKKVKDGVKILGKGMDKVDYPLNLEVSDASKSVIKKIQEAGGSIKLIHRTPLKLREHIYPNKYPLPLADPITPWWKVQKLLRKQQDRGVPIQFPKPAWMQKEPIVKKVQKFVYPIPRVPNPQKIRKRKPKLFKKINYGI